MPEGMVGRGNIRIAFHDWLEPANPIASVVLAVLLQVLVTAVQV